MSCVWCFLDSKTFMLGIPGSHFGTPGLQVGALEPPREHQSGERPILHELWVPFGCFVGPFEAAKFIVIFSCLFVWALGKTSATLWAPRGSKGMSAEIILRRFRGAGGNEGFVYEGASSRNLEGVPRCVVWIMMCAVLFHMLLPTTFLHFFCDLGSEWGSMGSSWASLCDAL